MASEGAKAKRILQVKIRIPSADTTALLTATMKNALSMYSAFGDAQVRLLRNADDRNQFLQVIEYQMDETIELNRPRGWVNRPYLEQTHSTVPKSYRFSN